MRLERGVVPVALPSLAQHWREFAARRDAWLILARNLVPVLGIYAFGWSYALTVFNYWFDGLIALAAVLATLMSRALRVSRKPHQKPDGPVLAVVRGVLAFAVVFAIVGTPYWLVLVVLNEMLLDPQLLAQLAHSPALWLTFAAMAATHISNAYNAGYAGMPEVELTQRVRWDVYLLILRAVAIFVLAGGILVVFLVPLLTVIYSYMEIWPGRALGLVFGDPRRLHELDPDKDS